MLSSHTQALWRVLLAPLFLALVASASALGQTFEPSYGAPTSPLQVCGADAQFNVKINSGGTAIAGAKLRVTLPAGYAYTAGSAAYVSPGTAAISDVQIGTNINIYDLTIDIPASGFVELKYRAAATCAVIGSTGSGFVGYTLRSGTGSPALASNITGTSGAVNFQNAKLVISSVTNQNYSGALGDTYTRDITITNTGYGTITGINLTSSNSAGFSITSQSVLSTTGSGSTAITTSGTAPNQTYMVAGVTLAQNQQIVIRENVTLTSCTGSLTTSYDAWYGCTAKCTQSNVNGTQTAGASITVAQPNIVFNSNSVGRIACKGVDQTQIFSYRNNGAGTATNVRATLSTNTNGATVMDFPNTIELQYQAGYSNFEYQIGGTSGAWTAATTENSLYYATGTCLTAPGKTSVVLPNLAPGQIVYIRYKESSCCVTACTARALLSPNTVVQFAYTNVCGSALTTDPRKLRAINGGTAGAIGTVPSDFVDGQTYDLRWALTFSDIESTYDNGKVTFAITLPAGAITPTASQLSLVLANGTTTLSPTSFATSGNVVTVVYTPSGSMNSLNGAELNINDLGFSCAGVVSASESLAFTMSATQPGCGCTTPVSCATYPIATHCAGCTRGGLAFSNFAVARTTFGLPDNNNDGIPDGTTLDINKVRTDYVMAGDTLKTTFTGTFVNGAGTLPTLTHAYASSTFDNSINEFSGLYANVAIYVGGSATPTYTTTSSLPLTYSSGTGSVDLSISVLQAHGIPASYTQFATGDKVVVTGYYMVSGGYSGASNVQVNITNSLYASNIANPTADTDKYYCDAFGGNFRLFSYGQNTSSQPTLTGVCLNTFVTTFFELDLGIFQQGNTNWFPYEYRPLAAPTSFTVAIPAGYTFTTAVFAYGSTSAPVTPVNASANPLVFDVAPLFANGTINYRDEGFQTTLRINLDVDCNTPSGNSTVNFIMTGAKAPGFRGAFPGNYTTFNSSRTITYTPGSIDMSSSQATVTTTANTVSWIVAVANTTTGTYSNQALPNTWFGKNTSSSGLSITQVEQLASQSATSGTVITPTTGGIYQLGTLAANAGTNYYKVTATLTDCTPSNLVLSYGYGCSAYPSNVPAAICHKDFTLTAQVQPLSLQLTVLDEPAANEKFNLCDLVDYEVQVLNPSQATGTALKVIATKPSSGGIAYEAGSFQVKTPTGTAYVSVSDVNVSETPTALTFSIPAALLASLGATETYSVKFQVRTTACEFVSGSSIRFRPTGDDICGTTKLGDNKQSNPIKLTEAPDTYNTFTITSDATPVNACSATTATSSYHYKMVNNNSSTALVYSFSVEIPTPWQLQTGSLTYAAGSYSGVSFTGSTTAVSGNTVYSFSVAAGMAQNAFVEFTAPLTAPAATLACGLSDAITETATLAFQATCSVDGTVCTTKQIVSDHTGTQIQVNRPDYSITAFTGTKQGPSTVGGTVTLANANSTYTSQNAVLKLYKDVDNSGTFTAGDVLLGSQTFAVANSASQTFSYSITSSYSGNICPLVAVVELECACSKTLSQPYACAIALPVTLASFTAKADGHNAQLDWTTSMELNNAYFAIEHSTNATAFEAVGRVNGKGTTTGLQTYRFVHENLSPANIHYYRLKQVDLDGTYHYSAIQSVQFEGYVGLVLRVTPNPINGHMVRAYVDYGDESLSNQAKITLLDLQGRTLNQQSLVMQKGRNEASFDASGLAAGTYLIRLENDSLSKPNLMKVIIK